MAIEISKYMGFQIVVSAAENNEAEKNLTILKLSKTSTAGEEKLEKKDLKLRLVLCVMAGSYRSL